MLRAMTDYGFTLHTPSGYTYIKADYADVRDGAIVFSARCGLRRQEVACFAPGAWSACHVVEGYDGSRSVDPERVAAALRR